MLFFSRLFLLEYTYCFRSLYLDWLGVYFYPFDSSWDGFTFNIRLLLRVTIALMIPDDSSLSSEDESSDESSSDEESSSTYFLLLFLGLL